MRFDELAGQIGKKFRIPILRVYLPFFSALSSELNINIYNSCYLTGMILGRWELLSYDDLEILERST